MAQAKTEPFDPALVRAAALAKALAHPVRLRILEILGGRRTCVCGGLVDLLPLAQSTVSQHLKELRDAGLIRGDDKGALPGQKDQDTGEENISEAAGGDEVLEL